MTDFLFRGSLADLDPDVYQLTQLEAERQARKLILIASESQAPLAVRDAMGSAFQNIYAEGYPEDAWRQMSEIDLLDYEMRLAEYRRNGDPRYYKGVEYADIIESLAITRARELFAANGVAPEQIHVNVQALSGGPANNAVYLALVSPGDTVMGMNLLHGGHLSHGSSVNRSGKWFNAVHYAVDPETQKIDYDKVRALALEHKPKLLIAGASSYSWVPDWKKFRQIADEVGATFLADISHLGGLVAAGVVPSPIGYAHVVMSTTHKSLDGPRGAVLLTTDAAIARKIDRAVFPGEQGGPHVHIFAALALTFKLAKTESFKQLQIQTIKNAVAMADQFQKRGFRVPFGGTDTHLVNVDVTTVQSPDGIALSGDMAARILDIAGIVVNRNTIPGDKSALNPSGIRLGTPWITQRGFDEAKTRALTDIMADLLLACAPHAVDTVRKGKVRRAKLDFDVLNAARLKIRDLAEQSGVDFEYEKSAYPHFFYVDDVAATGVFDLRGRRVRQFLDYATSADLSALKPATVTETPIHTPKGIVAVSLTCLEEGRYRLSVPAAQAGLVATWLRDLSDAYVSLRVDGQMDYDPARLPGPVVVADSTTDSVTDSRTGTDVRKPWFIGIQNAGGGEAKPEFSWAEPTDSALKRTSLYDVHKFLGGRMVPFAGWEMPVQYSSVKEEHLATRQAAGLFDVSHMGVYEISGRDAASFLDAICGNDCGGLRAGESLYTHFLTPAGEVIDDTLVYRRGNEKFLVVVNASNDDKDRTWFESVRDGKVKVDQTRPWARTYGYEAVIRNLRDASAGAEMRVDIALQGPKSRDILFAMGVDAETKKRIMSLKRTELCDAIVGGFDLIVSRTGYTGEKMAFELFVHPQRAPEFWNAILKAGEPFGVKPVGLAARDSLRTEAGLPLYGHEMGLGSGKWGRDLGVAEGGFGSYVKLYKPWFIGREAFMAREKERQGVVIRFRFTEQGVRMAHNGDPVVDKKGKVIGWVTSCSLDTEGYLTGQAYVTLANAAEGTPLFIYQGAPKDAGVAPAEMTFKDKATLPGAAVVVSRFAKL